MKKSFFTLLLCFGLMMSYGQALKVDASGNVGVGKASPTESLDVNGNIIIPNNQFYLSFRSDGTTSHQAFGMDANNDIVFNRNAIVATKTSGLIFGATNSRFIDFRDQNNSPLMRVRPSDGFVGIGTNAPTHALTLSFGDAAKPNGGMWAGTSDKRAKKAVTSFDDGLEQILQINPIVYQYNGKFGTRDDGKKFVGVFAQDMQKIAPYTVETKEHKNIESRYSTARGTEESIKGSEQYLSFDGTAIVYMLVNAVQEQQEIIEEKENEINDLTTRLERIESLLDSNKDLMGSNAGVEERSISIVREEMSDLSQNRPNPFSHNTTIDYTIPSNSKSAEISFHSADGQFLKSIVIDHTGKGQLAFEAIGLPSGNYNYTLKVDGRPVITKQMVISQ